MVFTLSKNFSDHDSVLQTEDPFVLPDELVEEVVVEEVQEDFDEEVLKEALGEVPKIEQYGEAIHSNLSAVISNLLVNGLANEEKEKLAMITIPGNCTLLEAPKLNPELQGVLLQGVKIRDKSLQDRQQVLGKSAADIAYAIQMLSKKDYCKAEVMKKLGEASRIICNLHFTYTELRKRLISPSLDKDLVESLKGNKRNENLFSDLEESVKSFSALKRSSQALKSKPQVTSTASTNKTAGASGSSKNQPKNFNAPRRQHYQQRRGAYQQRPQRPYKPSENQRFPANRGRAKYP